MTSSGSWSPSSGGSAPFELHQPGSWAAATLEWEDSGYVEMPDNVAYDFLEDEFLDLHFEASPGDLRTRSGSCEGVSVSGPASSECNPPERPSDQDPVPPVAAPSFAPAVALDKVLLALRADPFLEQALPNRTL